MTVFILQCDSCREKFKWRSDAWPEECPVCNHRVMPERDEVVVPFLQLRRSTADQVYRQMEAGSEHRVNVASEMLGIPKSELSDLKITDLKSGHYGDSSAPSIPADNQVNQLMQSQAANPNIGMVGAQGAQYSPDVQRGPYPNSGLQTLANVIRPNHGNFVESRTGPIQSEHRVVEINDNPNYKRRI